MDADIREDIAAGRLVRILEDWTPPLAPLCLYCYNQRVSSAALQASSPGAGVCRRTSCMIGGSIFVRKNISGLLNPNSSPISFMDARFCRAFD